MRLARLALVALLACWPALAGAQAITHVESTAAGGVAIFSDGTETFTLANTPSAGDLVCYSIGFANLTASGITTAAWADASGSWTIFTLLTGANSGALSTACSLATGTSSQFIITSAAEASGSIRHVRFHFHTTGTFGTVNAHVSGSAGNAQTSPHSSGNATPSTADNVCFALLKGGNNTYTTEAGWTAPTTNFGDFARGVAGYMIQTSATAQSYDPTSSTSADRAVQAVCVDSNAAAGGAPKPLPLLGVGN
jgi:hypothetical protein